MSRGKYKRNRERAEKRAAEKLSRLDVSVGESIQPKYEGYPPDSQEQNACKEDNTRMGNSKLYQRLPKWLRARIESSSITDWLLVAFTLVLAVTSIFQWAITGGQLRVMQNDERAWIKWEAQPKQFSLAEGQAVYYPFQITNIGKTVATNIVVKMFTSLFNTSEPVPIERVGGAKVNSEYPFNKISVPVIFPGDVIKQDARRAKKGGGLEVATESEIRSFEEGKSYLAIYGIITYDDLFGVHHWTKFCQWQYQGSGDTTTATCSTFNSVGDGRPYPDYDQ